MKIIKELELKDFNLDNKNMSQISEWTELINYLNSYHRLINNNGKEIKFKTIKKSENLEKKDVISFISSKKYNKYKLLKDGSGFIFNGPTKKLNKYLSNDEFFNSCRLDNLKIVKYLFNKRSEQEKEEGLVEAIDRYAEKTMRFFLTTKINLIIENLESFVRACYSRSFNRLIIELFHKLPSSENYIKDIIFNMIKACGTQNIEYLINEGYFSEKDMETTILSKDNNQKITHFIKLRDATLRKKLMEIQLTEKIDKNKKLKI